MNISLILRLGYLNTLSGQETECYCSLHSLRHPWLRSLRFLVPLPSWFQDQNTPLQQNSVSWPLMQSCFWTGVIVYVFIVTVNFFKHQFILKGKALHKVWKDSATILLEPVFYRPSSCHFPLSALPMQAIRDHSLGGILHENAFRGFLS